MLFYRFKVKSIAASGSFFGSQSAKLEEESQKTSEIAFTSYFDILVSLSDMILEHLIYFADQAILDITITL